MKNPQTDKFAKFLNEHIVQAFSSLLFLLIVLFIMQCSSNIKLSSTSSKVKSNADKLDRNYSKLDSMPTTIEIKKMIKAEGLRSEKRMIQATDRRILDVNRENAIDEELKKLGEK